MKIENILKNSLKEQGIKKDIDKICFNVILDNELLYNLCFLIDEDEKWLTLVETTDEGLEKVRIINKDYICGIEVVYNEELLLAFDNGPEEIYDNHIYS